jgi:tripartite-type tricarboxylate transporter receptor subunit TctC
MQNLALAILFSVLGVLPALAAEPWPARPLRVIVPVPPGGAVDIVARVTGARLATSLGEQVVVENRAGARGVIGSEAVARAAPDGYTLLVTSNAFMVMPFVERKLSFDVRGSFAPVSLLATQPLVLAVHPSLPARSVGELLALARSKPGSLSYGTGALGHYLAAEYVRTLTGFDMVHVPYKGGPAAVNDLVGGQLAAAITGQSPMIPHARSGRIRVLAVTTRERSSALPDVPTLGEAGVAGVDLAESILMVAPAGTPAAVIARLNAEVEKALHAPEVRERMAAGGFNAAPTTPQQLDVMIRDALERWGKLIPQLNIKPE